MIRFTLNPKSDNKNFVFDQSEISIGAKSGESKPDLVLNDHNLELIHLKVIQENDEHYIVNMTNDPFVTLNDFPFGRAKLKNNDVIQIGSNSLIFSEAIHRIKKESFHFMSTEGPLAEKIDDSIKKAKNSKKPNILEEKNVSSLGDKKETDTNFSTIEDTSDQEVEDLLTEFSELSESQKNIAKSDDKQAQKDQPEWKKLFLQSENNDDDDYIFETEEQKLDEEVGFFSYLATLRSLKWIALTVLIFLTIICIFVFGTYYRMASKNEKNEIKAARSVADIALALTYAKINHIYPNQYNWQDSQFLKKSIVSAISNNHNPAAKIDMHSRLNQGDYLLRIYTSHDIDRFIVIAQPEANLLNWFVPSRSIVVDSRNMQLRTLTDLKSLNRLLLNPDNLTGQRSDELRELIQSGELIPLAKLANVHNKNGFATPINLALIRPSAVNLIYNSPRYSGIGEQILEDAILLVQQDKKEKLPRQFQEQIKKIRDIPDVILYTSKGVRQAINGQKALKKLFPEDTFLIAYTQYDKENSLTTSHVLMENEKDAKLTHQQSMPIIQGIGSHGAIEIASRVATSHVESQNSHFYSQNIPTKINQSMQTYTLNEDHPLFKKLASLNNKRQKELIPYAEKVQIILKKDINNGIKNFKSEMDEAIAKYTLQANKESNEVVKEIMALYRENQDIPLSEFLGYIDAAGLSSFIEDHWRSKKNHETIDLKTSSPEFMQEIELINSANSFNELLEAVENAHTILNLNQFYSTSEIIAFQNKVRIAVLERLGDFILSPSKRLNMIEYGPSNRQKLQEILNKSWIFDEEEQQFFLEEFDHLSQKNIENRNYSLN